MGETIWTLNIKRGGIVMGNINDWYCACERALSGNKCDWCKEAIYHNLSYHNCNYGTCQKKSGW